MNNKTTLTPKLPLAIHVLTSLDFGGVERHMEIIASVLDHARMRHMFVAIGGGGSTERNLSNLNADVLCLGQKTNIPSFSAFIALVKLFSRERPLAVHTHGSEANFHGLLAAAMVRVPVRIGEEIGIPTHSSKAKIVFRLIYRTSHLVIGISQSVTNWLINSREVVPEKAVRLYNPVQLPEARLPESPDTNEIFRICFVGRLEHVKNPIILVGAAYHLISMNVPIEVWIIGDGSQRQQIEQEISKFGLTEQVKLLGFQSDPAKFIRQSSIYVQPSLSEGFGIALVEALGCGLPVIVTRVGGAPEIVEHGVTGWLLDDATEETLIAALHVAWLTGAEKLCEMGQLARQSVEGRFKPSDYLADLEHQYIQVATERGIVIQ